MEVPTQQTLVQTFICTFFSVRSTGNGMILLSKDSNCKVSKSSFEKNRGTGIFHTARNSSFAATNCSLARNKAKGRIIVAEDHSHISLTGTILKLNSIKPVRTVYDHVRSSLLYITQQSQLITENSLVESSLADGPCTGIFVEENSLFYSKNSNFSRNRVYHFGMTYCSRSSIHWRNSRFKYNQATIGGVLNSAGCSVRIEDCHMAYNVAGLQGGCLSSSNDTLEVSSLTHLRQGN